MKRGFAPLKRFPRRRRLAGGLALSALALVGACASSPSPPGDDNHKPSVIAIEASGGKPHLAAGTYNLLLVAETVDLDGDTLTASWSGPGVFHSASVVPGEARVRWNLPAGQYGTLTVTCRVSDGVAADSLAKGFSVGRALTEADYGELVGQTITWSPAAAPFYVLQQDVEIPAGVTLQVAAATRIYCEADKRLTIGGSLDVNGSAAQQVYFQPNAAATTAPGYWNGVHFESGNGSLEMAYCNLENAATAVTCELGTGLGVLLESCGFRYCSDGVKASFGAMELRGCRFEGFGQGLVADHAELIVENCTFLDGTEESLTLRTGSEGSCSGCFFTDVAAPIVAISGGSRVDFHGNRFFGSGIVFLVGSGYGGAPEPLDGRCNWWGVDGIGEAAIIARIDDDTAGAAPVVYTPWQATQSAACGEEDPPQIAVQLAVVFDARHPLFGQEPQGVDLSVMADDGYPRLLEVSVLPQHDGFVHDYDWSASAGGQFFTEATEWPPTGPESLHYDGQTDTASGSAIFFIPAGVGGETVSVTVTDAWGQSTGSSVDFAY